MFQNGKLRLYSLGVHPNFFRKASLKWLMLLYPTNPAMSMREMYQKEKAVCHAVQAELEQVKRERGAAIEAANGLDKMIGRAWGED